ncbi:uncharacterized protein [Taeniopygia guttata]|uniref:uncharacterized protein n=1 Tax=Taeniopygia guttata TaxID=59729 RepID=UPI003BB9865C
MCALRAQGQQCTKSTVRALLAHTCESPEHASALTRLGVNRQSLTSKRILDQSQLCRNTGKVAAGKAPGNNRCVRSVLIAHAPRVFLPAKSRRPLGRPQFPGQGKLEAAPRALRPRRTGRRQPRSALREPRCPRRARGNAAPGARTHLPPGPGPAPPPTEMPRPLAEPRPPLPPPPRSPAASGPTSDPQHGLCKRFMHTLSKNEQPIKDLLEKDSLLH